MLGKVRQIPGSPHQDYVNVLAEEYEQVMITGMEQHERSQQKLIGPSEIGVPCDRALLYKLAQTPEPPRGPAWKPAVGTACHSQQEEWFSKITTPAGTTPKDWEVEQKVAVGNIGNDTILGSTDLYAVSGTVIDHKFVGKWKLNHVKAQDDPGPQYRVQAHTYGRGWSLEGFPVHVVMIAFHMRDGELTDSYYWWEHYDEQVAVNALQRANERYAMLTTFGLAQALNLFPLCTDQWCPWCNRDRTYDSTPLPALNPATPTPAFYQ